MSFEGHVDLHNVIVFFREKVKSMFYHAYNGYLEHAYPLDELKPLSCTGKVVSHE